MKIKNFFLFALLCSMATGATAQTYYKNKAYQWKGNEIIQGKEKGRAVSATEMTSNYQRKIEDLWDGRMIPSTVSVGP